MRRNTKLDGKGNDEGTASVPYAKSFFLLGSLALCGCEPSNWQFSRTVDPITDYVMTYASVDAENGSGKLVLQCSPAATVPHLHITVPTVRDPESRDVGKARVDKNKPFEIPFRYSEGGITFDPWEQKILLDALTGAERFVFADPWAFSPMIFNVSGLDSAIGRICRTR